MNIAITTTSSTGTYGSGWYERPVDHRWSTIAGNYESTFHNAYCLSDMVRLGFLVKQASEDLESPSVQVSIVKVRDGVYKITENYSTCSRIYQVNNYGINGPFQFQANDGILKGFLIDGKIHGIAHLIVEGTTKETIKGIFVKGQELPASGFRYSTPTNQKSGAEEEIHAWHVDGFKWLDMPINNHLAAGIWGRSSWTATTSNWPNMTIGIATSTYTTSNYTTTITS